MRARGGQVQELFGATPLLGQCVPGEEGGPGVGRMVEVTLPTMQRAQGASPSRGRDPRGPCDRGGGRDGG